MDVGLELLGVVVNEGSWGALDRGEGDRVDGDEADR